MNLAAIYKINSISIDKSITLLFVLTLIISSFKNIAAWNLYETHNQDYYHFPILDILGHIHPTFDLIVLAISIGSLILLKSKSAKLFAIPFIINGVSNLYFMFSDYLQLHHDMLLSGMIFVIFGLIRIYNKSKFEKTLFSIFLAVVASTYLLSGIAKINVDFLSGEMTVAIINRAEQFFYWPIMEPVRSISIPLSWFAMSVEIIEPILLVAFIGSVKLVLLLLAFPFHLGILLTGTGTVYNLIYPASFMYIINKQYPAMLEEKNVVSGLYKGFIAIFIMFSIVYIVLLPLLFIHNLMLKNLGYGIKELFL